MAKKAIFLIGDSHATAFQKAQVRLNKVDENIDFYVRAPAPARLITEFSIKDAAGKDRLTPVLEYALLKDGLVKGSPSNTIASRYNEAKLYVCYGSSEGHRLTLSTAARSLRVCPKSSRSSHFDAANEYVPRSSLAVFAGNGLALFVKGLSALRELSAVPFALLAAPPVTPSAEYIAQMRQQKHGGAIDKLIQAIPDLDFRQARWLAVHDLLRKHCRELGVEFIENPPDVMDARGFLRQRYWLDGVHANHHYAYEFGKHLIETLLSQASAHAVPNN